MRNWFNHLKTGLDRGYQVDQISGQEKPKKLKEALKDLLPYITQYWRIGLFSGILIILNSLLVFPYPLINRFLIDDVILAHRLDLLPLAILLFGGLKIAGMGTGFLQQYLLLDFEQSVILKIQADLLNHTLKLPKSFFDKKEVGYLISRISSDVQNLRWFFSGTLFYLITNIFRLIGGLIFLFILEWRLALVSILALPAMVLSSRYFSKFMRNLSSRGMEQNASIMKHLQEAISSIPLIKAFSTEENESRRIVDALEDGRKITMQQGVVGSFAGFVIGNIQDLVKAVVFIAGAYLAIKGEWSLGSLLAFSSYLGLVISPTLFFANLNLYMQNSLVALERVMSLFNIVPEENLESGFVADHLRGEIEFKNVSFSYGSDEMVLKDLSFHVSPGEKMAIVGSSGAGKTTLISLILYFYKPTSGKILIDGRPAGEYNLRTIRRQIGYVSQSNLVLSGTIAENLRYGNSEATQKELERACRLAGLHDFIMQLPKAYESRINERGVNLSEGQKQRLSIARALIKSPAILILDEPTSALDSNTEQSIFNALPKQIRGKTLFIISHRLSTIHNADRIMVLSDKQSVEVGTHIELMEKNDYYRSISESFNS
jgi:ABC-type bacteriocin/lantibiotic exporter with double-glycine peptidase domain